MKTTIELSKELTLTKLIGLAVMVLMIASCKEELPEVGSITDRTPPAASFSHLQLSPVNYLEVTFTNTSTSATDYSWDFGDGGTSNELEPVHAYDADGTYIVELTATDKLGVSNTTEVAITLSEPLAFIPPISEAGFEDNSDFFGCTDGDGVVNNDGRDCWRNSDLGGVIQITTDPVQGGVQAAKLTGDPSDQRIGYQLLTVTENTVYDVSFSYTMKDDQPGWLTVSILDGPVFSHAEALASTIGSITVDDQTDPDTFLNATVPFDSGTNTEVAIYFFNGGSEETRLDNFSIALGTGGPIAPTASFTYSADPGNHLQLDFSNNSINADSYLWDFGDTSTSADESPTHTYAADGTYTVTLTASNVEGQMGQFFTEIDVFTPSSIVITNPSFDDFPAQNDNREAWRNSALESDADAFFGYNGSWVLQMSTTSRTGANAGKLPTLENSDTPQRWLYQAVTVEPNTDYMISGWIRNKNANVGSSILFEVYDSPFSSASTIGDSGSIIASEVFDVSTGHDTDTWTEATISFNSGASSEVVLFVTNDYSLTIENSESFCDDFSIEEQ